MGQLADQRVNLFECQRRRRSSFEITPYEAIRRCLEFECGGTGVVDNPGSVLSRKREDAEDAACTQFAMASMDLCRERTGVRAGTARSLKRVRLTHVARRFLATIAEAASEKINA